MIQPFGISEKETEQLLQKVLKLETGGSVYSKFERGRGKTTMLGKIAAELVARGNNVFYFGQSFEGFYTSAVENLIVERAGPLSFRAPNGCYFSCCKDPVQVRGRSHMVAMLDDYTDWDQVDHLRRMPIRVLEVGSV